MLKRTTVLMDPDLLERLDRFAARTGVTKTSVIAAALEAHLEKNDTTPDLPFWPSAGATTDGCPSMAGDRAARGRPAASPGGGLSRAILLDSSAILAAADQSDLNHRAALAWCAGQRATDDRGADLG